MIPDSMEQSVEAWVMQLGANLGVAEALAVEASIPVIRTTFANRVMESEETGLGDLSLLARYDWTMLRNFRATRVAVAAGVILPVGEGVQNPMTSDRNFVSGTVDPVFAVMAATPLGEAASIGIGLYARPILGEDDDGTKTGGFVSYSLTGRYRLPDQRLDFSLRLSGQNRAQDRVNGLPFASSGGDWVYVVPGLSWDTGGKDAHGLQLWSAVEIPVYQYVHGDQLTEDWSARLGLRYGLDLFGHEEEPPGRLQLPNRK